LPHTAMNYYLIQPPWPERKSGRTIRQESRFINETQPTRNIPEGRPTIRCVCRACGRESGPRPVEKLRRIADAVDSTRIPDPSNGNRRGKQAYDTLLGVKEGRIWSACGRDHRHALGPTHGK